jgi:hypothetical protein
MDSENRGNAGQKRPGGAPPPTFRLPSRSLDEANRVTSRKDFVRLSN